jgi:hypothetical protein
MSVQSQAIANRARLFPSAVLVGAVLIVAVGLVAFRVVDLSPPEAARPTGIAQARAHDDPILFGYGWVDKNAGVAHVPIQRAMDLVLQQGLPARAAAGTAPKDQGQTIPSYPSSGAQPDQVLH